MKSSVKSCVFPSLWLEMIGPGVTSHECIGGVTAPLEGALRNSTWLCYICCWCWQSKLGHSSCDSWSLFLDVYQRVSFSTLDRRCADVSWSSGRNSELQDVTLWMKARWGSQIIAGSAVGYLIIHSMSHTVAAVVTDTSSSPWKHFTHFWQHEHAVCCVCVGWSGSFRVRGTVRVDRLNHMEHQSVHVSRRVSISDLESLWGPSLWWTYRLVIRVISPKHWFIIKWLIKCLLANSKNQQI